MNPRHLLLLPLLLACPTPQLTAQNMAVPDGEGRILQLFDLAATRAEAAAELRVDRPRNGTAPAPERAPYPANLLRHFIEPALGDGDDLEVLGHRWLALLGSPTQIASLDRLMTTARQHRESLVTATVQLVATSAASFDREVRPLLPAHADPKAPFECILPAVAASRLAGELAKGQGNEVVTAPRVTVAPLQRASVSVMEQIAYVQDFTVTHTANAVIADPIVATVWDGVVTELCTVVLDDGAIGIHCDMQWQQVQRPIAEFETDLGMGGAPVKIQLPRTTGVRLQQTARLAVGDMIVLGNRKADGTYLLAIVEAHLER